MNTYTPTNWKQGEYSSDTIMVYDAPNPHYPFLDRMPIATVYVPDNCERGRIHARLITAAPQLAEALRKIHEQLQFAVSLNDDSFTNQARAQAAQALALIAPAVLVESEEVAK